MSVSALLHTFAVVFGGQALAAAIFVPLQTEKFYDLCGSLGFLSATATALLTTPPPRFSVFQGATAGKSAIGGAKVVASAAANLLGRVRDIVGGKAVSSVTSQASTIASYKGAAWRNDVVFGHHPRQWIAAGLVILWAGRLGSFLFLRILKSGRDPRFDSIKKRPLAFLGAWTLQALWVGITASPVYMLNALPTSVHAPLGVYDALALGVWASGMGLEVVADREKSQWREGRENGKHKQKFIHSGVWAWSRHPNYFGEVLLWAGQAMLALPTLMSPTAGRALLGDWAPVLAVAAPILEYLLLRYISGVPLLEESMDKKLKGDKAYNAYKRRTPCFVPFVGSTK